MNSTLEMNSNSEFTGLELAVIGMAGRFPGAKHLDQYWHNLINEVESISFFTKQDMADAGIDPAEFNHPDFVMAKGMLEDIEYFDAGFFGYLPKEAEIMHPQLRIFHECAWAALEDAGYEPESCDGQIGVFAGGAPDLFWQLLTIQSGKFQEFGAFEAGLLCNYDPMGTRLSYKLNLTGPSFTMFTACSTSGVAIHQGCQALLGGECHIALAGAVSLSFPQKSGYIYQEGMINSPDGHCRVFNGESNGTVFGDGIGVVILRLLDDALTDRDHIYAIIKGSALNNDGSRKAGYTAPSTEGQVAVMRAALYTAGVEAETISYIEAHGTGTSIGDSIEGQALKMAYTTDKKGFCGVGSVKSNIGHLNTAAGMSGFIKVVLALKYRRIPPTLHFQCPNPKIDFIDSPFYVVTKPLEWENHGFPLRAGVSIFGLGGTNFHAILEEAPGAQSAGDQTSPVQDEARQYQLILFSAKNEPILEQMTENLAKYFRDNSHINLADAAYTLQVGRKTFKYRRMLLASSVRDAADALSLDNDSSAVHPGKVFTAVTEEKRRPVIFMLPDVGPQYVNMGRDLYEKEPVFQEEMDRCFDIFKSIAGLNIKEIIYPGISVSKVSEESSTVPGSFNQPEIAHAAVFILEYALVKLLNSWGIKAETMIGYGLGEYASACIAGVFSLEDALTLVIYRARLPEQTTEGAFSKQVAQVTLTEPGIPYISSVTGEKINGNDVTHSDYWVEHLRETPQFEKGLQELLKEPNAVFMEMGPGRDLSSLVEPLLENPEQRVMNLVRTPDQDTPDLAYLLEKVGLLWLHGIKLHWKEFYAREKRGRISLPTYPFEKSRYWIEGNPYNLTSAPLIGRQENVLRKETDISDWFYAPIWKQVPPLPNKIESGTIEEKSDGGWLVFADSAGIGIRLAELLKERQREVVTVTIGTDFSRDEKGGYTLDPCRKSDYQKLIAGICQSGQMPRQVVHLWSINPDNGKDSEELSARDVSRAQDHGIYSLLYLVKALQAENIYETLYVSVVTNNMQAVSGEACLNPEQSPVLGAVNTIPQENPDIRCRSIDILLPGNKTGSRDLKTQRLVEQLLEELSERNRGKMVALRDNRTWVQAYEPMKLDELTPSAGNNNTGLKEGGVYLLIGGLGGIGLALAQYLASSVRAKLVLVGRSDFPARDQWEQWLNAHSSTDRISQRIRKIREMEEAGGEVSVIAADVADEGQMQTVVSQTEETYGQINGVIHLVTTAAPEAFNVFGMMEKEHIEMHFQGKLWGLLILKKVLAHKKTDFVLIMSSVSSILGGMGLSAYAASNIFVDSFIRHHNRESSIPWLGVNWDTWQVDGKREQNSSLGSSIAELYVTVEEGIEVFKRILGQVKEGQVIHSVGNLQARLDQWINLESLEEDDPSQGEMAELHPRPDLSTPYVAPSNDLQQSIENIWKKILGFEKIGIKDDFLELGGDSLKVITVISAVRKQVKTELSIPEFFENPCIEKLAEHIEIKGKTTNTAIPMAEKKEYYILSPAQKRFYFFQQLDKESIVYNECQIEVLEGFLDVEKIEKILQELVKRHEGYRTSIIMLNEEPVQMIHDVLRSQLKIQRLGNCSAAPGEEHNQYGGADRMIRDFIQPFDLSNPPLLRAGLIQADEQRHILIIDRHHIVHDEVSSQISMQEVSDLYAGMELPPLQFQYRDYAEWQNSTQRQNDLQQQKAYWLEQFQDEVPVLNLPADYSRTAMQDFHGDILVFEIHKEQAAGLKNLALKGGTTLYTVLLALVNILLSKISGQEDIVLGTVVAGRRHVNLEWIIGMFVNTIALRNYPKNDIIFIDFLRQVKENTLNGFENQDYPFEDLVEQLDIQRDTSRNPLFDVMFELRDTSLSERELHGLTLIPYDYQKKLAKFDLAFMVEEVEENLKITVDYCTKLFKKETIARFISYFREIVYSVIKKPDAQLCDIEMVSETEREHLLKVFKKVEGKKLKRNQPPPDISEAEFNF